MMLRAVILMIAMTGSAHAENLDGKAIKALISGKSANWVSGDGKISGVISWRADGAQSVTGNFKGFDSDNGKWRVKGGQLCSAWTKIRAGKERCEPLEDLGGGKYRSGNNIVSF